MRTAVLIAVTVLVVAGSIWFLRAPQIRPQPEAVSSPSPPPAATISSDAAPVNVSAPPDTILFEGSNGNVTFDHKKHYERVGANCAVCHPKVFPQSRQPLNYKKASHRAAEASLTSCAHCHAVGGTSFAADSNCLKCHVKDYSKR